MQLLLTLQASNINGLNHFLAMQAILDTNAGGKHQGSLIVSKSAANDEEVPATRLAVVPEWVTPRTSKQGRAQQECSSRLQNAPSVGTDSRSSNADGPLVPTAYEPPRATCGPAESHRAASVSLTAVIFYEQLTFYGLREAAFYRH